MSSQLLFCIYRGFFPISVQSLNGINSEAGFFRVILNRSKCDFISLLINPFFVIADCGVFCIRHCLLSTCFYYFGGKNVFFPPTVLNDSASVTNYVEWPNQMTINLISISGKCKKCTIQSSMDLEYFRWIECYQFNKLLFELCMWY